MRAINPKSNGAVIVTRVSTGEQVKHGTSLESQLEMCRAKALALNLPIVAEYEDAGISGGFLVMRAGMQSALADIQAGRANTLICATISRFSRVREHQSAILREVQAVGGQIVFCDMTFDDTPEGDLAFNMMGDFADYERKLTRSRTMSGKRKRAEQGQQPQRSRSPYGYHIVTNAEVECGIYPAEMRGRYVVDEATAETASWLFDSYASGTESLPSLCKKLNTKGTPSPGGGFWHEPTIRLILTNSVYRGRPVSGRHKCHTDESRLNQINALTGAPITRPEVRRVVPEDERLQLSAPVLVSDEVWDAVQVRLGVMKAKHGGNPKRMRMLSGICVCPYCGERAVTKYQQANGKTYSYYWCSSRNKSRNLPGDRPCKGDLYSIEIVEQAALLAVQGAWQHPEALTAALAVYKPGNQTTGNAGSLRGELADLEKALVQVRDEETATVQAQIAGIRAGASPDLYAEAFAQLAGRRKDLEDRRGVLSASLARPACSPKVRSRQADEMFVSQALEEALRALTSEHTTGQEKRVLLGTVVEKVILHKEGADVVFTQGIMNALVDKNNTSNGASRDTFHTTCIGMRTQR